MKVLISTKAYPRFIDKALKNKITDFSINEEPYEIKFIKDGVFESYYILPVLGDEQLLFKGKFNHLQWYKLSEFLKQLPEQPIVLEFQNYDEDEIRITLSQFHYCL
jgi:hypothetical protein